MKLEETHRINPAGEGGEIETFVTDAPLFSKKIIIKESQTQYSNFSGRLEVKEAILE